MALSARAQRGELTARQYNACLLLSCWELVLAGDLVHALRLLSTMPASYLSDEAPEDAATCPPLVVAMEGLAARLVTNGHVEADVAFPPSFPVRTIARA